MRKIFFMLALLPIFCASCRRPPGGSLDAFQMSNGDIYFNAIRDKGDKSCIDYIWIYKNREDGGYEEIFNINIGAMPNIGRHVRGPRFNNDYYVGYKFSFDADRKYINFIKNLCQGGFSYSELSLVVPGVGLVFENKSSSGYSVSVGTGHNIYRSDFMRIDIGEKISDHE